MSLVARHARLLLCLGLSLHGASCARLPEAPEPPQRAEIPRGFRREATTKYAGFWTVGFETSAFVPCGSSETWWLSATNESTLPEQLKALAGREVFSSRRNVHLVYLEAIGRLSEPGHFGHLGAYPRDLQVSVAKVVRLPSPTDCVSHK
jgi:hypothetical protein